MCAIVIVTNIFLNNPFSTFLVFCLLCFVCFRELRSTVLFLFLFSLLLFSLCLFSSKNQTCALFPFVAVGHLIKPSSGWNCKATHTHTDTHTHIYIYKRGGACVEKQSH